MPSIACWSLLCLKSIRATYSKYQNEAKIDGRMTRSSNIAQYVLPALSHVFCIDEIPVVVKTILYHLSGSPVSKTVKAVQSVKWFGRLADTAVCWPEVGAVFGAAVWVTDWPLGTWVRLRPVDTRRMKDIRWCWQIVTSQVCCDNNRNDHFLLMPERQDWELEKKVIKNCFQHCYTVYSFNVRLRQQTSQTKPRWK